MTKRRDTIGSMLLFLPYAVVFYVSATFLNVMMISRESAIIIYLATLFSLVLQSVLWFRGSGWYWIASSILLVDVAAGFLAFEFDSAVVRLKAIFKFPLSYAGTLLLPLLLLFAAHTLLARYRRKLPDSSDQGND